jgi:hypothetical protein
LTMDEANDADGRLPGHSLGEGWFFISLLNEMIEEPRQLLQVTPLFIGKDFEHPP